MSEVHLSADEQAQLAAMQADEAQEDRPETPQAPAAAQQPAAQPQEPAAPAAQPEKTVPLAALHEARAELKAERERGRLLEERTNLLLQRFNQPPPQPAIEQKPAEPAKPAIPDIATDPVGHIVGTQQDLARQVQETRANWQQQQGQITQQLQQMQIVAAITQQAQALERQFTGEQPDYPQAVAHLTRVRDQQLQYAGITNPAERGMIIQQEGLTLAARMLQQGGNPAKAIYDMATTVGYAPPSAAADQGNAPQQTAQAEASAPNQAEQRLQNIAAGQNQAQSLGNVRGSGPAPLTAQRLVSMSQQEFAKIMDSPEVAALMGA